MELVYAWFQRITDKVSPEDMLALLSKDDLEMQFPEKTLRTEADFREWYDGVTHLFFDQVHDLKLLAIDVAGNEANVTLIVNWQARTWKAPAARSDWQGFYVHQDWTVKADRETGKPVICRYHVGTFDPMPAH